MRRSCHGPTVELTRHDQRERARSPGGQRKKRYGNAVSCAPGTIPMPRITLEDLARFATRHRKQAPRRKRETASGCRDAAGGWRPGRLRRGSVRRRSRSGRLSGSGSTLKDLAKEPARAACPSTTGRVPKSRSRAEGPRLQATRTSCRRPAGRAPPSAPGAFGPSRARGGSPCAAARPAGSGRSGRARSAGRRRRCSSRCARSADS
jgi:hypothetical protein